MVSKKIRIFFAIPCGEFFSIQTLIIKKICEAHDIQPVIIEEHLKTDNLWNKITEAVDDCDFFIADISSRSLNVVLELGYALREKKPAKCGIFISGNIEQPVDLRGFNLQIYKSFKDFKEKLNNWILDKLSAVSTRFLSLKIEDLPTEDFKDIDKFLRLWSTSPGGSFFLTDEGLRFTNAHFPIMTNYLALLTDYEFEFRAKIVNGAVGWSVKGTKHFGSILPQFCVMFNIGLDNKLTPHIFNINKYVAEHGGYQRFDERAKVVKLNKSKEGWFTIKTIVKGDEITILNDKKVLFKEDFSKDPYKEYYDFPSKQGEVGFRCYQGVEEAIIQHMNIKEI